MNIITQLEFELNFTNSEKEIAHYLLSHGEDVLKLTVSQLSQKTYASPATIVRLCQKLGLEGYNDFKIKYSAELENKTTQMNNIDVNFPFDEKDSYKTIAHKMAVLYNEVIKDTIKYLNYDELNKVVHLLNKSSCIDLYGSGNSLLSAMSFQHKMTRINKNVNLRTLTGEQAFFARSSNPKHTAIIISYSGETFEMIRVAKILKQRSTPIIVLTSLGDNQISHYGDYILHIESREKIFNKIAPFASSISTDFLFNLIYSYIFSLDYKHNTEMKVSFDKAIDTRHPHESPIND